MAIQLKFCTAKRTLVPVGPAKFDVNWCNESLLRGEKPDFWPVTKFNTGGLPLRGILPVMMWLPDGRKSFKIGLAVLMQCQRCDIQPPSQPRCRSKDCAYVCVARVKTSAGSLDIESWYHSVDRV